MQGDLDLQHKNMKFLPEIPSNHTLAICKIILGNELLTEGMTNYVILVCLHSVA